MLDDRVTHLDHLIEQTPSSGVLESRMETIEKELKCLENSSEQHAEEIATMQLDWLKLNLRLEQCSKGLTDVTKRFDSSFKEQFNALAEQSQATADKFSDLESCISQFQKTV